HDVARFFIDSFQESGVLENVVMFLSLADAPSVERLMTPRSALTMAEYLAFHENMHILVILTDMTNYCEALREVSTVRGEIPSRKGYPGYLYSDLASLYERAGIIEESQGSITQMPILTMPNDDISHPIPDLSGYMTEGQIVLERELDHIFEKEFLLQNDRENRSIEQTLDLGWKVLSKLPKEELHRVTEEELSEFYGKY
ncbi:MAG: V-type ATP synthase subunit B, partial [bacterium]